jgi:hypothetical protein
MNARETGSLPTEFLEFWNWFFIITDDELVLQYRSNSPVLLLRIVHRFLTDFQVL